jgi:anti-sigma factor RsiW
MDHSEATRRGTVEKYLLDELPNADRDEFEQHFFDCLECAADLKTTAAFLDAARRELKRPPAARAGPKAVKKSGLSFLWRPAFLSPAFALLLIVIVYQNLVMFPRAGSEIAVSDRPEVLASVSLIGGNSRSAAIPSVTIRGAQPLLLSVDIPTAEQFSSYACVLTDPAGAVVWRVPVSAEQAKDTVSVRIPAGQWRDGDYRLIVQGNANRAQGEPAELARYRFILRSASSSQ